MNRELGHVGRITLPWGIALFYFFFSFMIPTHIKHSPSGLLGNLGQPFEQIPTILNTRFLFVNLPSDRFSGHGRFLDVFVSVVPRGLLELFDIMVFYLSFSLTLVGSGAGLLY